MRFLRTTILRVLAAMSGMRRPDAGGAGDPLTGVREPVRRRPGGRSPAIALREPDGDSRLEAVGVFRAPASPRSPR